MKETLQRSDIRSAIRKAEPIEECGLIFYPIMMDDYEKFLSCKDAIILRLGTLPVRYQIKDYLNAIFCMEMDAREKGEQIGLFANAMSFLLLSLQIKREGVKQIYYHSAETETQIDSIVIEQAGKEVTITPIDFSAKIRPLLALQNGLVLPDESENVDLVKANELKISLSANSNLDSNTDDLIASVAYQSRVSEREIMYWTVREFEKRKEAIERDKRFMLYGQAEMSGMVQFKKGNPYPSWCFDAKDESMGTIKVSEIGKANQKNKQKE